MSGAVMDRCITHFENSYECPNVFLRGHVCRTNIHSNTAFRGFGAPQGMYFAEAYMYNISESLGIDIDELPRKNLYKVGYNTPFFQNIDEDWHVPTILDQLDKGIEEPPLFLGSTVFFALREAVKAARIMNGAGIEGRSLESLATCEILRLAVGDDIVERTEVARAQGENVFFVSVA